MTAANPQEFENTHRRLSRLLIFLIVFLSAVIGIAVASRLHWFGTAQSNTFFDSKGILTGPGTFIVLIGAALSALIVFVAYKKWTLKRSVENASPNSKAAENARRVFGDWLSTDVLKNASTSAGGSRIEGQFHGRHVVFERFEIAGKQRLRYSVDTDSTLALKVWWLGKTRTGLAGPTPKAEFETGDSQFEGCCGWQAAQPREALQFLNRGDVTGSLHRICFISGLNDGTEDIGIALEKNRIVLTTRIPPLEFTYSAAALVAVQEMAFLADAVENKNARPFLTGPGLIGSDPAGDRNVAALAKPRSPFISLLSCVMFILFVLVPLAALWIAGSYYCAKALDMSAGMLCFFLPVLLMAIFVFTRPAVPEAGSDNDMETVRAAALKFWEQTLRADPEFAALLDAYERRLEKSE